MGRSRFGGGRRTRRRIEAARPLVREITNRKNRTRACGCTICQDRCIFMTTINESNGLYTRSKNPYHCSINYQALPGLAPRFPLLEICHREGNSEQNAFYLYPTVIPSRYRVAWRVEWWVDIGEHIGIGRLGVALHCIADSVPDDDPHRCLCWVYSEELATGDGWYIFVRPSFINPTTSNPLPAIAVQPSRCLFWLLYSAGKGDSPSSSYWLSYLCFSSFVHQM
jgi:hypothetical protein